MPPLLGGLDLRVSHDSVVSWSSDAICPFRHHRARSMPCRVVGGSAADQPVAMADEAGPDLTHDRAGTRERRRRGAIRLSRWLAVIELGLASDDAAQARALGLGAAQSTIRWRLSRADRRLRPQQRRMSMTVTPDTACGPCESQQGYIQPPAPRIGHDDAVLGDIGANGLAIELRSVVGSCADADGQQG